jgi:hypothetical protein
MSVLITAAKADQASWGSWAACLDCDPGLFFPIAPSGPALQQMAETKSHLRSLPGAPRVPAVCTGNTPGPRGVGGASCCDITAQTACPAAVVPTGLQLG